MSIRALPLAALACLLGVVQACGSRPIQTTDGGGDASQDRPASGAAGTGGMANAGTTGGAGTGTAGTGAGGTAGMGSGVAGSGVAGSGVAGSAGTAGVAGTAGTAGAGGRGGAIGIAGRGGSGGTAGAAGGAGRGGTSGTAGGVGGSASAGRGGAGGTAAPGPECMTAADCKLVSDCCTCAAIPVGAAAPSCSLVCIQSQCDARQLPRGAVACVAGRCVAGFACDTSQVTCRIAPPNCPAGEVPSVTDAGTCYTGACAPATQCTLLPSCDACTGADPICVVYQTQRGNQFHCVSIPPACGARTTCDCLGPTTCVAPYRSCADLSGRKGITCSCLNC
jgi:hypothetical protein